MIFRAIAVLEVSLLLLSPIATAQTYSNNFGELVVRANSAREQNDIPHAMELYQQAVQMKPEWPDGWWYLGSLQYGANDYGPAIDALTHYIDLMPKAAPAFALRGLCNFEEGQYAASLQDTQRAISLGADNDPRNAGILIYHEALLLTRLGRYEEALAKYNVLIKHGTITQEVIDGLGLTGLRMPILPKEVAPSQQQLVSLVGHAAMNVMSGNLASGDQEFEFIFDRFPAKPYLHYLYGYLLSVLDPEAAIAQFKDELKISPSSAIAHSMLAWELGIERDYLGSLPYARLSIEEDPSLGMAQLVLGRDLVETGDMKGALPYLEGVLKGDPQDLEAHLALVKAYSNLGQKEDARRERLLCLELSKRGGGNGNM